LVLLPVGRVAGRVVEALVHTFRSLSMTLRHSLTGDHGREMGVHRDFTVATNIPVYFCDPRSPWQCATHEKTDGLLRQSLPKGADLSSITQNGVTRIEHELNGRPRRALGWRTPAEALAQSVAMTD
jgi:transposase, IS30 family